MEVMRDVLDTSPLSCTGFLFTCCQYFQEDIGEVFISYKGACECCNTNRNWEVLNPSSNYDENGIIQQ